MSKFDRFIERCREIAALYNGELAEIPGVILPEHLEETESGWHLYMIQLDCKVLTKSRRVVFDECQEYSLQYFKQVNRKLFICC